MPKQNKDSRFDRVLTGKDMARKVMKDMDDPKSPWSKERAMDMAAGSVSGSGIVSKLKGTQPVSKAIKMSENVKSGIGKMKDFIKETHKIDDLARSKGVHKIKSIAPKGKDKFVSKSIKNGDDLGYKSIGKEKSSEKGFTSRGKEIGKKIGDQGGSRGKFGGKATEAREQGKVIKENKREASFKRHAGHTEKDIVKGTKTHVMKPGLRGDAERKYGDSRFGPYPINRGKKINHKGKAN